MTLNTQQKTLITDLIEFNTTSANSNVALIDYIANRLDGTGATITLDHNANRSKVNLLATIGPADANGGIILSGHTDTVPVEGQNWDTDPYKTTEKDGKLFARGSVDMKGFDALALSQLLDTAENQDKLRRPLSVLLTYDEEVGCFGVQNFLRAHSDKLGNPDLVLVGEPTNLKPVIAHKGIHCFEVSITGLGGHSSDPGNGVNAIKYGTGAVQLLYSLAKEFEISGLRDDRFTPPHSTLNVGTINGGSAVNIIADKCEFIFETRPIPGETRDALLQKLQKFFHDAAGQKGKAFGFKIDEYVSNAPFVGNPDADGTKFLLGLLPDKELQAVPFMTEASALSNAGFNTVVCGPGNIAQAHQPNEFIAIEQLERGAGLISQLTQRCFQPI